MYPFKLKVSYMLSDVGSEFKKELFFKTFRIIVGDNKGSVFAKVIPFYKGVGFFNDDFGFAMCYEIDNYGIE